MADAEEATELRSEASSWPGSVLLVVATRTAALARARQLGLLPGTPTDP